MAENPEAMGEAFGALTQFFVNDGTLGETLLQVSELACKVAPADMAGITMLVDGKPSTGVFTDQEAPEIDQSQYETGEGPCLDAFRKRRINRIDSTRDDKRWPAFTRAAADHGILSTLSVPIIARDESLGALNLYSRSLSGFDDRSTERTET
ncbi:MAG TPA: GAF domain-containing protein, partial [Acidimicrobiales bacterium]|nr:GAF domain-containing protein [Acidimicrobiales bacterium]